VFGHHALRHFTFSMSGNDKGVIRDSGCAISHLVPRCGRVGLLPEMRERCAQWRGGNLDHPVEWPVHLQD
jgi:hypothetical protein